MDFNRRCTDVSNTNNVERGELFKEERTLAEGGSQSRQRYTLLVDISVRFMVAVGGGR